MNIQNVRRKNRKAISPVLATVILIAITLIAAVAIAGFVFGLFGSFTSSAQVSAQITSCKANASATTSTCTFTLTNTGTSNVSVTGCAIQVSGASAVGVLTTPGQVLTGGAAGASNTCTVTDTVATQATVGSQAVGSISLSNGASVPFSGVWS